VIRLLHVALYCRDTKIYIYLILESGLHRAMVRSEFRFVVNVIVNPDIVYKPVFSLPLRGERNCESARRR